MCLSIPNFNKIGHMAFEIPLFFDFHNGGCVPSWICLVPIWNTHDEYLVVLVFTLYKIWLQAVQYFQ